MKIEYDKVSQFSLWTINLCKTIIIISFILAMESNDTNFTKEIDEAMVNGNAELATKIIDLMSGCFDPF